MIDALISIGMLLMLLKASDLLVLKEQQLVVEEFVEQFTLRLNYFDEFVHQNSVASEQVQHLILLGTIVAVWLLTVVSSVLAAVLFETMDAKSVVSAMTSGVFSLGIFLVLWHFPLKQFLTIRLASSWTRLSGAFFVFLAWLSCLTAELIFTVLIGALFGVDLAYHNGPMGLTNIILLFGILLSNNTIGQLLRKEKETDFHIVAIALKPILWRIVAFNKGVFPGVVAALTLALALYKLAIG